MLRSYAAAHGLNSTHHAVVEVSANEITLRVNDRWLRFTPSDLQHSGLPPVPFILTEDGNVRINNAAGEPMDFTANSLIQSLMTPRTNR
jgi:hypothetical protein